MSAEQAMDQVAEQAEKLTTKLPVPTLDEIRGWPATVSPEQGGLAFGIRKSYSYQLINEGRFPAQIIEVGNKKRVVTASILQILGGAS